MLKLLTGDYFLNCRIANGLRVFLTLEDKFYITGFGDNINTLIT
ncbi:hypothetical protein CPter291_1020 [Collimonas pratensis]|uniref:Uncharacterized protein n=1 Tax=Collimonas pratensis TaxID=279113 RepID=A0ABM5Z2H0_9BURK|nr:hypothetical protein CPter291_1020 [Collimonas pratensis]